MALRPNIIWKMVEKPALDRTDYEILEALQADARLSNKELAQKLFFELFLLF